MVMNNNNTFIDIRDNLYLSDVYRYIEQLGIKGHQIGRKVGDMLEVLTLGIIYRKTELKKRCGIDKKVEGFTGARHAVEFVIYELDKDGKQDESKILAILECKKVGVEVTKLTKYKNKSFKLDLNNVEEHGMGFSWLSSKKTISFNLSAVTEDSVLITVTEGKLTKNNQTKLINLQNKIFSFNLKIGDEIKLPVDENEKLYILGPNQYLTDIKDHIRNCHFFELNNISNNSCNFQVKECLTGPQTIEKAKQAALVSLDVRRKVDGSWGKEEIEDKDRTFVSCLIIGEASHWEEKSRKVIRTTIDYNIIVPDSIIITLIQKFRDEFGDENFLDKITKSAFKSDADIQQIVYDTIDGTENKIFYDLDTNKYVNFDYKNGKIIVEDL